MEPLGPVDSRERICSRLPPGAEYVVAVKLPRSGGEEYQYRVSSQPNCILWVTVGRGILRKAEAN